MPIASILIIAACVIFFLTAIPAVAARVNGVALGLALWTLSIILGL